MAGWHSLSGYLQYKSGNNALGRLITKRRAWCILEESRCQLLLYKCEEDVHKHREPHGNIDVHGAAISLDLEHPNQFVIISERKEHVFTAENHESMMIWLLGLQAKRDLHSKKSLGSTSGKSDGSNSLCEQDYEVWSDKPSLYMTYDQHHETLQRTKSYKSSPSLLGKGFHWEKYGLKRIGESVDSGVTVPKRALESSKSFPLHSKSRQPGYTNRLVTMSHTVHSFESDSDDVFGREMELHLQKGRTMSGNWRKLQRAVLGHQTHKLLSDGSSVDRRRSSSRSASSDSAIERGEGTPQELLCRLSELERELISTKCELAKVLNRQTCYQELLFQKDDTIKQLEENSSDTAGHVDDKKNKSPSKQNKSEKEFQEKVRVLQNQNRFLNEEVKKLAKLRLDEHTQFQEQNMKLQSLEAEIEKWKMDYVSLIESSIRFPGEEGVEDVELTLYGGDKHKKRVQALLEEARKINPRLPTYESLANNEVHVDTYGFKHIYTNTGLLLHYLCTELTHHYLVQAGVYEEHQKKWTAFMRQHGKQPMSCVAELRPLCRGGIPDRFRKQIWHHLVHYKVRDLLKIKGDHYYRNLCNMLPESPLAACYRKQVSLDLMRTMPSNTRFSTQGSKGIMDLQDVLLAYCIHNPTIGYCQGMNFIVGMSLIFMDPEDAFWTLVAIAESYFSPHYFDHSLIGAQSDQQVLKDMVKDKLPALYQHLESIDIELSTITLNWFLAVFFDAVPFQTLLRIWDCFLLEGPKVLFRFSLAILKLHERDILQKTDTMGIMKHLKACAKLTYDVEGLVKLAYEGLKPFPKRKDIISKQTCYLNALKEKYKKKELQRLAFAEREQMYMNMEAECGPFQGIECAVAANQGVIWFCYGDQNIGRLCSVSCESGTMSNIEFKLDSRLMCMCFLSPDEILLGTISWMLVSMDIHRQEQAWQIQLHDAILAVCCYDDSDVMAIRIFSGLADGTVAVTEKPYRKTEPNVDIIYIAIGQAPVTCLMLLDDQLWCASGNTVAVLHAKTLDAMDIFSVSVNPYDHILSLAPSDYGIWISLRGSSILELWDPQTLHCRMLYDTRTDRYPQLRKEDDTYFNRARITSTLANGNAVWVGTGEGNLIIYEVLETTQLKTPTDLSPTIETSSSMSYVTRPEKPKDIPKLGHAVCLKRAPHLQYLVESERESSLEGTVGSFDDYTSFSFEPEKNTNANCSKKEYKESGRRRSSSENDLQVFQGNLYQEDPSTFKAEDCGLHRPASEMILEQYEKSTDAVNGGEEDDLDHVLEDEMEVKLEALARKESIPIVETELVENFHDHLIRKINGKSRHSSRSEQESDSSQASVDSSSHRRSKRNPKSSRRSLKRGKASESARSNDSGCEGSLSHKFRNSASSSRRSSVKEALFSLINRRKSNAETEYFDASEDPVEARLEEQARRESLTWSGANRKEMEVIQGKLDQQFDGVGHYGNEQVTVLLETVVNQINEENLVTCTRRKSLLGTDLFTDDNYISSSPSASLSTSPVSPSTPIKECRKQTTQLGMSIDSLDDAVDADDKVADKPQAVPIFGVPVEHDTTSGDDFVEIINEDNNKPEPVVLPNDVEDVGDQPKDYRRRRSSVIDDISILCSDCRALKKRCTDCKKLLKSQASLKVNERRLSRTDLVDSGSLESIEMKRKRSATVDYKKMNGIKSTNMTKASGEWFCATQEEKDLATHRMLYNTDNVFVDVDKKFTVNNSSGHVGHLNNENCDSEQVKIFPSSQKRDITRQEKVGYWLDSITNQKHTIENKGQGHIDNRSQGQTSENCRFLGDESQIVFGDTKSKQTFGNISNKGSWKGSQEETFFSADESFKTKSGKSSPSERPVTLNLSTMQRRVHSMKLKNRLKDDVKGQRSKSVGSEGSSGATQKSSEVVLNKKSPGVQYRLEFSNVRVETDVESGPPTPQSPNVPVALDYPELTVVAPAALRTQYRSRDSRKNSLDLGHIQENCKWVETECSKSENGIGSRSEGRQNSERQQIFELLKTPSLASRHASLGLKILKDDLEWTELYSGQCTTPSPTSTADQRLADFLRTPSMSSKLSSGWSSYDNISTPSQIDDSNLLKPGPQHRGRLSHSPSTASIGSEVDLLYNVDLHMEAKMKISDKPVKCLLSAMYNDEPIILSFSGSVGDDEAVLKWQKHKNEQLWTNQPILELCPKTKTAILPTYMRRRLSSNASCNSHCSALSENMNTLGNK